MTHTYAEQRRFTEAVDNMEKAAAMDRSATILSLQAHVLALAGERDQSRRVIRQIEESTKGRYFCPYEIGSSHATLGDLDTAYSVFSEGGRRACRLHSVARGRAVARHIPQGPAISDAPAGHRLGSASDRWHARRCPTPL